MRQTRAFARAEQDRLKALNTALRTPIDREDDSAVSPGDKRARKTIVTSKSTSPTGLSRPQFKKAWQDRAQQSQSTDDTDPRLYALRQQMSINRRESAPLPVPIVREVLSDEETIYEDNLEDWRVALPPVRPTARDAHEPWNYNDRAAPAVRHSTATAESGVRNLGLNSVERASIDLAHKILAVEHNQQIADLGGKIYDQISKRRTIDDALFDPDSDGSLYSEDLEAPLQPGLIRMQSWLQVVKRLQGIFLLLMVIMGATLYFQKPEITRWMILLMVLLVPSWFLVIGLAERESRERSAFETVLRSGLLYVRGENPARPRASGSWWSNAKMSW